MGWLEIIEIRAVVSNRNLLESHLQDLVNEVNRNPEIQAIKIYKQVMLETDFSIHLFHDSCKNDTHCSSICEQLASSLKDFGMVDYAAWIEKDQG